MDANETLADIVAEMREYSGETTPPFVCFVEDGGIDVSELADRIEAAALREREAATIAATKAINMTEERCKAGNAAKLREALEEMTAFWEAHGCAFAVQVDPVRESQEDVEDERDRVMAKAKAALAAPPRNCDRFGIAEDAVRAFEQSVSPRWRKDWKRADFWECIQWLFSDKWDGKDGTGGWPVMQGAQQEGGAE